MDVDANILIEQLSQQIGRQAVEITALRLQLDAAYARVTELENANTGGPS